MKIVLSPHLKIRLKERRIPQNYPTKILSKPDSQFIDTGTDHLVAIKKLMYNKRVRPMVVVYDIIEREIQIITIHPSTTQEINNKVNRGRWIEDEKKQSQ